jgi:hypothetical protein
MFINDLFNDKDKSLNEVSNELLGRYKKAAGADASAADKRGDIERGNKRFRGIVKATVKQGENDVKRHKEQGVEEAGPFSYGAKKPKKGSVADLAARKRQEQERGRQPIEPRDQMVGVFKILPKDVSEGTTNVPWNAVVEAIVYDQFDTLMDRYGLTFDDIEHIVRQHGFNSTDEVKAEYGQDLEEAYDTSEGNREYFDNVQEWAQAVLDFGGEVVKARGVYVAHGWEGEAGEFDPAAGEGWLVSKAYRMNEDSGQRVKIISGLDMYIGKTGTLGKMQPHYAKEHPGHVLVNLDHGAGSVILPKSAVKIQGVAEGTGNIGNTIKSLYQKIYNAGDDEIEYFYHDSPIFAQYWDEYEGDLDSIIAEVDPKELQIIHDELESYLQQAGLAEGLGKSIKRAAQGWGGAQHKPSDIIKRNKAYDTDTAKKVRAHLDDAPDHTPAGLQKRVLDRKLKGVAEGSLEEVSQDTARSYAQKAQASQKDLINQTHRKGADIDKLNKKIQNRQQGLNRAHTDKRYYKDEQGMAEGAEESTGPEEVDVYMLANGFIRQLRTDPYEKSEGWVYDKIGEYLAQEGIPDQYWKEISDLIFRKLQGFYESKQSVAEGSEEYCDACDRVITKKPHVCPGSQGVAEGAELKQAKRKYNQAAKDANLDQVGAGKKIDTMKKSLRQKDVAKQGVSEDNSYMDSRPASVTAKQADELGAAAKRAFKPEYYEPDTEPAPKRRDWDYSDPDIQPIVKDYLNKNVMDKKPMTYVDKVDESRCNMTEQGRSCPAHGITECPGYSRLMDEAFKMPPESVQDRMHRKHQELRKKSGLPDPSHYKELAKKKQEEIDALRAEIAADKAKGLTEERYLEELERAGYEIVNEKKIKQRLDPKCWTGYKKQGTKIKGGVRVNNCVPKK